MGGQTDGWYIDKISLCFFKKTRHRSTIIGTFQLKRKVLASLARLLELGGVSLARHQLPREELGCSSERRKRALVTVNVSTSGKTLLAGCILGTNMFLVVHCLENSTWVAPKPLSLFTGKSEHCLSCSGCSKWKSLIMFHLPTLGLNRNVWMSSTHADITSINAGLCSSYKYLGRWFSWVAAQNE